MKSAPSSINHLSPRSGRWPRSRFPGRLWAPVVLSAIAVAACGEGAANEADSPLGSASVKRSTIVASVDATGTVEPIRVIDVKSQASGEILELPVELGDQVERGALLVRIDPRDVRNAYEQAQADLEVAQARLDVSQRQLERTRALRDSAVVTEDELETAVLEFANARAALVKAQTNLALAEDRMNDVTLRAPISGTIVERQVEEGTIVTSTREVTGGTTLMRMADLSEVQVRTLVDETDIGRVSPGLPARITVEAFPDRTFRGTVLKIEPQAIVEQNVTLFAVLTRISNEEGLLKPGMNADVEVVIGREEDVLALPNGAVKTPDEARQLARALGIDPPGPAAAERGSRGRPAEGAGQEAGEAARAEGAGQASQEEGGGSAGAGGPGERGSQAEGDAEEGLTPERLQAMSPQERRQAFERLSPAERQRLFEQMRQRREEEERANRSDPARPRPAYVFVADARGGLTLRPITVGLSSWEHTQVLEGLEEGDQVVEVPLALIQQRELLERIRSRSGVPGVSRN